MLNEHQKKLVKMIQGLGEKYSTWSVFNDFLTMAATAISNAVDPVHREEREKLYMEAIGHYRKDEQSVFPEMFTVLVQAADQAMATEGPKDILGAVFHDLELHNKYKGQLLNLTRTTVSTSQSLFIEAANRAFLQVKSGSASYTDALTEAVKSAARQGTTVLYDAAGPTQLDVAMRRAVLTGVNQAAASVTLAYADEVECDYVETTAHAGARPTHVLWQGQVFCISGRDTGYRKFAEATGYGKVDGLCGVNCRHNFYMFWPGISVPVYTQEQLQAYTAASIPWQGQMLTEAEARAMQRAREVRIRESKRTLAVLDAAAQSTNDAALKAALQAEFAKEARLLDRRQASLQEFCAATKRRMDTARTQVHAITAPDGRIISFDRALARKAADVV